MEAKQRGCFMLSVLESLQNTCPMRFGCLRFCYQLVPQQLYCHLLTAVKPALFIC